MNNLSKNLKCAIICGPSGSGKTDLAARLYRAHQGPKIKTHLDLSPRYLHETPNPHNFFLCIDECYDVVSTINQAWEIGYRNVLICTQHSEDYLVALMNHEVPTAAEYLFVSMEKRSFHFPVKLSA